MHAIRLFRQMRRPSTSGLSLALLALLATLALPGTAGAATTVPLGTADSFAVLGGTPNVTNTGPTVVNGDLGVSPAASCTGFQAPCLGGGPGVVNGTIYLGPGSLAATAQGDLITAFNNAAGQTCNVDLSTVNLGGLTLTPGVYCYSSSAQLTGTLTLDGQGDPNAVFIFQIGTQLTTAPAANVNLINGAQACNLFWKLDTAVLDTTTNFAGNILALTSITLNTGATVNGRLLARNGQVALDTNTVTRAQCGPNAVIAGLPSPKKCVSRNFKLRVRVSDSTGIGRTDVYLDGRRIKRSRKSSFSVTIKAAALPSGTHKIRVVSRDAAGNKTVRRASFKRCQRAKVHFPRFTG
jgi:ice-binding like protein/Big-like domain-containing protein